MKVKFKIDDLSGKEIKGLLQEHLLGMAENTPAESIHALSISDLKKPDVIFWSAWHNDKLLGCGALKQLTPKHAEIKSMRTVREYLRKGVATQLLLHLIQDAKSRGYERLSLETGSQDSFVPARTLYKNLGFKYCEPFEGYVEDSSSVFMEMILA